VLAGSGMNLGPALRKELYLTLLLHGADPMVLATVAAWDDSMEDSDVLKDLRNWNEAKLLELREWLPSVPEHEREAAEHRIQQYEETRSDASLAM
jgi:hypothetical protein